MSEAAVGGLLVLVFFAMVYIGTPILADQRGRNWKLWLVLTFCLPIIAPIILMLLPDVSKVDGDVDRDSDNVRMVSKKKTPKNAVPEEVSVKPQKRKQEKSMELEFTFRLENGDSYETDEYAVSTSIADLETQATIQGLLEAVDVDRLNDFFQRMFSNPTFDGSDVEGLILSKIAPKLCDRAFRKLGWSDVTAAVTSIRVGGTNLDLEGAEVQDLLSGALAFQLVQDDATIYFYN